MTPHPKIVYVEWIDCSGPFGWTDIDDAEKANFAKVVSTGFLIAEHKDRITLSATIDLSGESVDCPITIPRVVIKKIVLARSPLLNKTSSPKKGEHFAKSNMLVIEQDKRGRRKGKRH